MNATVVLRCEQMQGFAHIDHMPNDCDGTERVQASLSLGKYATRFSNDPVSYCLRVSN